MLVRCIVKDASGNSIISSEVKANIISVEDWELPIMKFNIKIKIELYTSNQTFCGVAKVYEGQS